ncbi:MAG: CvpA family protein [Chloroflexota bacterium]|nr:CvpA family protein [Dehalococcoidia bacterium]MDW8046064.1 CvpA family protein [Chloroflexota bacterium]
MDWVSILIVGAIALLTWRAYRRGLIRELVSLAAVLLAIPVAGVLYDDMAPKVEPIVANDLLARLVSFLSILFAVIIAGQVGAYALRRSVELLNLGAADRLAGGFFGFVKGFLIVQAVLIALVAFPDPDLRADLDASPVARRMLEATPVVLRILPDSFEAPVRRFLDGLPTDDQA